MAEGQITTVRVPREQMEKYQYMPWRDVLDTAKRGDDGLSVKSPGLNLLNWDRPPREMYADDEAGALLWKQRVEAFDAEYGMAYFYEGDKTWPEKNKTVLLQQNWNR